MTKASLAAGRPVRVLSLRTPARSRQSWPCVQSRRRQSSSPDLAESLSPLIATAVCPCRRRYTLLSRRSLPSSPLSCSSKLYRCALVEATIPAPQTSVSSHQSDSLAAARKSPPRTRSSLQRPPPVISLESIAVRWVSTPSPACSHLCWASLAG